MKKFLAALLFVPAMAWAQEGVEVTKKVKCFHSGELLEALVKQYNEHPLWMGKEGENQVALTINPHTNAWTLVQLNGKVACVLAMGEGFSLPKPSKKGTV